MERSRLPLLSLLGLCGALLLLMGIPKVSAKSGTNKPGVAKAVAFALELYNQDREDNTHYYKLLRVLKAELEIQVEDWVRFSILAQLVKTTCQKKASWKMSYQDIRKCKRLPGKEEEQICFFRIAQMLSNMKLEDTSCI